MLCKRCNMTMSILGTSYHRKKSMNDKGYQRYNECPSCHYRKYNDGLNFQEILNKKIWKNRSI